MINGYKVSFWADENIVKWDCVTDVHLCEYTESYWIVNLKCLNCTACELNLHKAVFKSGGRGVDLLPRFEQH